MVILKYLVQHWCEKHRFPLHFQREPWVWTAGRYWLEIFNTAMVRLAWTSNYIACKEEWYTKSQRCFTPSALLEYLSSNVNTRVKLTVGTHTPQKSRLDVFQAGYYRERPERSSRRRLNVSNGVFNHSSYFLLNSLWRFRGGCKDAKDKGQQAKAIVSCPNQSTDFFFSPFLLMKSRAWPLKLPL